MESGIKYHNPQPPIFITAIRCFIKCVEYYFCNKKYNTKLKRWATRIPPKHLPKTTKTPTENYQNTYRKPPKHLQKTTKTLTENHQNTYRKPSKHLPKTTKTPTENHQNTYRKPPKHLPKIALAIYPLFRQTYVTNFCQTNLWLHVHFTMVKSSQGYLCYTLLCIYLFNVRNIN
jgi:hypothetical protein